MNVNLQALLNLNHQRDLEGHFTTDTYPECIAIRQWIAHLSRVDAYFSLHSAHCISPGLFFYPASSLAFVTDRFQPQYVGVSEMPLAVCSSLAFASLNEIEQCNRDFKQTGDTNHSIREIDLAIQLHIMESWIWSVISHL
jgi:hypothetical protein